MVPDGEQASEICLASPEDAVSDPAAVERADGLLVAAAQDRGAADVQGLRHGVERQAGVQQNDLKAIELNGHDGHVGVGDGLDAGHTWCPLHHDKRSDVSGHCQQAVFKSVGILQFTTVGS